MIRYLLPFIVFLFVLANATAQTGCTAHNIAGVWKECGAMISPTYSQPPAVINTDSLKKVFHEYNNSSGKTWRFNADGNYLYEMASASIKDKGRYEIAEKECTLKLSTGKKIRIVYIGDSCMILWHNNPKTAYLTVYRR